jgi:hypothetical protein
MIEGDSEEERMRRVRGSEQQRKRVRQGLLCSEVREMHRRTRTLLSHTIA